MTLGCRDARERNPALILFAFLNRGTLPDQAGHVLDELREMVAALYLGQIQDHVCQEHCGDDTATDGDAKAPIGDDLTF